MKSIDEMSLDEMRAALREAEAAKANRGKPTWGVEDYTTKSGTPGKAFRVIPAGGGNKWSTLSVGKDKAKMLLSIIDNADFRAALQAFCT